MNKGINQNNKNGMWKGKDAGLVAIHKWVIARKPKPKKCEDCGKIARLDLANISQKYKRDVNDFEWICRKCHMTKDGRMKKLIKRNKDNGFLRPIKCEMCKKKFQPKSSVNVCCSLSCCAKRANKIRWSKVKNVNG